MSAQITAVSVFARDFNIIFDHHAVGFEVPETEIILDALHNYPRSTLLGQYIETILYVQEVVIHFI